MTKVGGERKCSSLVGAGLGGKGGGLLSPSQVGSAKGEIAKLLFLPRLQIVNAIQNARKLCGAKPFNEAFKSFGIKGGLLVPSQVGYATGEA